jgi:hypothetical protein
MKRLILLLVATVMSVGLLLSGTPGAQAQPIDCSTHVLDATVRQGIYKAGVERQVNSLRAVDPTADVYVQAYEQLPGGTPDAFWALAQQQCANWFDASGTRVKDNVLVVVYGHDIDDVGLYAGNDLELGFRQYRESTMNGMHSNLGPNAPSSVNPDYVTEALTEAVRATELYVRQSLFFDKVEGVYHPPVYFDPNASHKQTGPRELAGIMIGVVAFFTLVGLVAWGLQAAVRRSHG